MKIAIDVSKFDKEKIEKTQDAFFKIGHKWGSVNGYLNKGIRPDIFTNFHSGGSLNLNGNLMHGNLCDYYDKITHTYEQLLDLAGIKVSKKDLTSLNTEELLEKLTKNNNKISKLIKQNNKIADLICHKNHNSIETNTLASLTKEELAAGGWICSDISKDSAQAFKQHGLSLVNDDWNCAGDAEGNACVLYESCDSLDKVMRINLESYGCSDLKPIYRKDNNFYWESK